MVKILSCIIPTKKLRHKFRSLLYENNKIFIISNSGKRKCVKCIKGLEIEFNGINSIIEVHCNNKFNNSKIIVSDNCFVSIGKSTYTINNFHTSCIKNNCKIIIGNNFSCHGIDFVMHDEPDVTIKIGDDCMFSYQILIRPADGHIILDENNNIINYPKDIIIGNHVWIGTDVKILKGSFIPDNSIVGLGSIFTSHSSKNLIPNEKDNLGYIFTGIPAKVVKQNVQWFRDSCSNYLENHTIEETIK